MNLLVKNKSIWSVSSIHSILILLILKLLIKKISKRVQNVRTMQVCLVIGGTVDEKKKIIEIKIYTAYILYYNLRLKSHMFIQHQFVLLS